ncbi:MAG TPA: His/Gly/Thr/Pro-type tRNA ligase C-terminal domain-containing protein [Oligoflexia bacterium]|nr:His/Gly/Thr/Pro-type tRNA ligase C-terminal domain-containing protein [Oligoflexia bacterium]HMP26608.1 His/Gly/Thr/Pro-type tRNA ligase C-terminal domain-containing protein [Oligoflexia bacterium]
MNIQDSYHEKTPTNSLRQSTLFTKPLRQTSKEEISVNAQLLTRGGFVNRLMAGVYSFLPLGVRVLTKIENIIRQEMNHTGSQEILMPALHPKEIWETTGRWQIDILYKIKDESQREFCLGPSHEETVVPLVGNFIQSYKDLPISVYQIQTKYRKEARPKSGILRGREFRMKDMYSFHASAEDLDQYYELAIEAYKKVFARCGLKEKTFLTYASGGIFSRWSHEFQAITPHGEDEIHLCRKKSVAINKEIFEDVKNDPEWKDSQFETLKAIEVGNIFKLGSRFSNAFNQYFSDSASQKQEIIMGCYGLGSSRLMGAVVECSHDQAGIIWPKEIAPFDIHLLAFTKSESETKEADQLFEKLSKIGIEILYDDRNQLSPGEKLVESDLLGVPLRIIASSKTLANGSVEIKWRDQPEAKIIKLQEVEKYLKETQNSCCQNK